MKTYPILSIHNHNYWRNWTNTYLKEIDSKARSLFDYVYYFNPDFFEFELQVGNPTEDSNNYPVINTNELPLHAYYKVKDTVYDQTTQRFLEPGTLIVNYARGEGEIDKPSATIRNQAKYYIIQPFGWASFYILNGGDGEQISFTYIPKAQEIYGLNYTFAFDTYAKRYFIKKSTTQARLAEIIETDTSLSFLASDGANDWYILNKVDVQDGEKTTIYKALWTNITNNPLMHEFYYTPTNSVINATQPEPLVNNQWNCEQIVFDHTWKTSSKIAETNIAVYTINKKDSSKWPPNTNLWFEAW